MQGLYYFVKSNLRWLAGGLLLTFFSSFGQTFFISLFSGQIRSTFDLTDGQFGLIYMVSTLASALTLVWVGRVVDHVPVARVAFVVVLCLALACLGMSWVSSIPMLLAVIYALRLFGQGLMTHASQTAMGRWYSAKRGLAVSLTSTGYQLGEALLPSTVLLLVAGFGWRQSWQVAATALVLFALPAIVLLMRVEHQPEKEAGNSPDRMSARSWTRAEAIVDPAFWMLCLGVLAPAFIGTSVFFHQVHIVELKNWTPQLFATSFLVLSITTTVSTLLGGWLIDRLNSKRLLPVFLLPMGVGCLLLGFSSQPSVIFAFMFLLGCSFGFSNAIFGTIWPETYGVVHLGAIRAIAVAAMVFASALGPGLTGGCIDRGIGFEFQLLVMAGYCLVASVGMLVVAKILIARENLN